MPLADVGTLPPSAVTRSAVVSGAVTIAVSSPRTQRGTSTGSVRTSSQPISRKRAAANATASS
jgi:hypothetical protein